MRMKTDTTQFGCGIHRRDSVRIGALTALGLSVGRQLSASNGNRDHSDLNSRIQAKSCILLWLDGGPSHLETFDLKPDAPVEVRGPFQPIESRIAGIRLSELLPETAMHTDKIAIVRSMTSPLGEHGLANQYLLSGYKPSPVLQYPGYGSVISHLRPRVSALPQNVAIPDARSAGAGYLGSRHDPFFTGGDPSKPDFRIRDLNLYDEIDALRLKRRQEFLAAVDAEANLLSPGAGDSEGSLEQAFRLMTSGNVQKAFDLSEEPASVRARYGPRMFGQSCLLARRLVENGVPFVTVNNSGWDTHEGLVLQLKLGYSGAQTGVGLVPTFDVAFSALIEDLSERGLLNETLVLAMGEFGRTPKLNARGGRDHWPRVFSVVLCGGGVNGGQIIGSSDRHGESPLDNPVTPADLAFSIYSLLGVRPDHELHTADGRPVPVNQGGRMIPGLT